MERVKGGEPGGSALLLLAYSWSARLVPLATGIWAEIVMSGLTHGVVCRLLALTIAAVFYSKTEQARREDRIGNESGHTL